MGTTEKIIVLAMGVAWIAFLTLPDLLDKSRKSELKSESLPVRIFVRVISIGMLLGIVSVMWNFWNGNPTSGRNLYYGNEGEAEYNRELRREEAIRAIREGTDK